MHRPHLLTRLPATSRSAWVEFVATRRPGIERVGRKRGQLQTVQGSAAAVLGLQRSIGNRGTQVLLREPVRSAAKSQPGEFGQFPEAYEKGGLDAALWKAVLDDARREQNEARKQERYTILFGDLASAASTELVGIESYKIIPRAQADRRCRAGLDPVQSPP